MQNVSVAVPLQLPSWRVPSPFQLDPRTGDGPCSQYEIDERGPQRATAAQAKYTERVYLQLRWSMAGRSRETVTDKAYPTRRPGAVLCRGLCSKQTD